MTKKAPSKEGGLDRVDVRRAVGLAVARISAARKAHFNDPARQAERERMYRRWRDLQAEARKAELDLDRYIKTDIDRDVDPADVALIAKMKRAHPDLLVFEDPNETPICCAATGLAMFEGDETFGGGDPQYGACVLKAAVGVIIPPVSQEVENNQS